MLITDIKKVNKKRLGGWGTILAENQSTAFVLIGVGHNSNCGKLNICICEGIAKSAVAEFLRGAADEIDPEKNGGN